MREHLIDEKVLRIVKAMALGKLGDSDIGPYCIYCEAEVWTRKYSYEVDCPHESNCPITLARQVLAEQGMPLIIYRVVFDLRYTRLGGVTDHWGMQEEYTLACTEQEAIEQFADDDRRNARASFVDMLFLEVQE